MTIDHVVADVVADHADADVAEIATLNRRPSQKGPQILSTSIGNLMPATVTWTHRPARHDHPILSRNRNRDWRRTMKMASPAAGRAVRAAAANDKCCRPKTSKAA